MIWEDYWDLKEIEKLTNKRQLSCDQYLKNSQCLIHSSSANFA